MIFLFQTIDDFSFVLSQISEFIEKMHHLQHEIGFAKYSMKCLNSHLTHLLVKRFLFFAGRQVTTRVCEIAVSTQG